MIKEILISLIAGIILIFIPFIIKFYKKWRQNWYDYIQLKIYSGESYNSFIKYCINYVLYRDVDRKR